MTVGGNAARILAIAVRAAAIFFGTTILAYTLLNSARASGLDGYADWLTDFDPLRSAYLDATAVTLQALMAATIVASVGGAAIGWAIRRWSHRGLAVSLWLPVTAAAGPPAVLTTIYWLVLRSDLDLAVGSPSLVDTPTDALRALIVPALAVGLPMVAPIATMLGSREPHAEPYGVTTAGSLLASRSEPRDGWRFGYPAGVALAGLLVAELALGRRGLGDLFHSSLLAGDLGRALDAVAIFALGAAALSAAADVAGLRHSARAVPSAAGLRLAALSVARPSSRVLRVSLVAFAAVASLAAWGRTIDTADLATDPDAALRGPLSSGHLLGTDRLGRDLGELALAGLGRTFFLALAAGAVATMAGVAATALIRRAGGGGGAVLDALFDMAWWPISIVAFLAAVARNGRIESGLVFVVVAAGLTPTVIRMIRRDSVDRWRGGALVVAGVWLTVSALGHIGLIAASYLGPEGAAALGAQLAETQLAEGAWPAVVASLTAIAAASSMLALSGTLFRLGWHRSARRATTAAEPVEPEDELLDVDEPTLDEAEPALLPNYGLQPGLPVPEERPGGPVPAESGAGMSH